MHGDDHTPPRELATASERVFEGRIVSLRIDDVRFPDGRETRREVVEHRSAVAIVPLLPDNRVLLVRQWRHPVGEELVEIPAGLLEPGEQPIECAQRELAEETGYNAGRLEPLASFYSSPGFNRSEAGNYDIAARLTLRIPRPIGVTRMRKTNRIFNLATLNSIGDSDSVQYSL